MKTTGVSFPVHTIRVTELLGAMAGDLPILGSSLVRTGLKVTMTPVIKTGETKRDYLECGCVFASHKEVDTFQHFEFALTKGWLRRFLPDRDLDRILDHHCAIEFWTKNEPTVLDQRYPWIHWLYPSTSWLRAGRGRWTGRSYAEGPRMKPEDYPADTLAATNGGFWKTATPPPERRSL